MMNKREGLTGPYFERSPKGLLVEPTYAPGEKLPIRPKTRWRSIGAAAIGLCLVMDPLLAQIEASPTSQYISEVVPSIEVSHQDTALNTAAGLGRSNSFPTAETLAKFAMDGAVWATTYDSRTIDGESLAGDLIKKAKRNNVIEVNLWGGSMAGTLSLEMAVKIQNDKSAIHTKYIILEDSPSSLDSVRPDQRESGQLLLAFSGIPALSYSRTARFIAEMAVRTKQYAGVGINQTVPFLPFNLTKFIDTSEEVIHDMLSRNDKASVELMGSQYSSIVTSNARANMMKLGQENEQGKPKPIIVFIRPVSSTSDRVVDSDKAEAEFRQYALDAGLRLVVIRLPGIHHGNPSMSRQLYQKAIPVILKRIQETIDNPLAPAEINISELEPEIRIPDYSSIRVY